MHRSATKSRKQKVVADDFESSSESVEVPLKKQSAKARTPKASAIVPQQVSTKASANDDVASCTPTGGIYIVQEEVDALLKNNRYKVGSAKSIKSLLARKANASAKVVFTKPFANEKEVLRTIENYFTAQFKAIPFATSGSAGKGVYEGNITKMTKYINELQ